MSDKEALQGLWKIESMISGGRPVGHSGTHWEFKGDLMQEIIPNYVDGGQWAAFVLDETTAPKRMDKTYTHLRDNKPFTRTFKEAYELSGDTLKIGGAKVFGTYPEQIDDAYSVVTTLSRFDGSRPETKKASGKTPLESAVLGTVTWDDNRETWNASVLFAPDQEVAVTLEPDGGDPEALIAGGAAWVNWLKEREADARAYAAKEMLDLAEDWRDEDETPDEITEEIFASRIRLTGVVLDEGATLYYDDDEIFAGHTVVVSLSAERTFTDAQMMG